MVGVRLTRASNHAVLAATHESHRRWSFAQAQPLCVIPANELVISIALAARSPWFWSKEASSYRKLGSRNVPMIDIRFEDRIKSIAIG